MDNRERLNKGFESTLNATVLADGDGWRKMRDSSLLQGWMVARPTGGQRPRLPQADHRGEGRLKDEWSKRHPETHIDAAADQLTNHVNITYTDQSPALQATLNAFNTAGVPWTCNRVEDAQAFQAAHGDDATFFVDSRLTGQWHGLRPRQDRRSRDVRAGQRRGRRRLPNQLPQGPGPARNPRTRTTRPQETSPAP